MKDLILKSFNGLAKSKSYGNKTLQQNIENADSAISKMQYTERIWDRSRSQWMLKFLACSNADGWLRIRQVGAEMHSRKMALNSAKFTYLKNLAKVKIKKEEITEEENDNKRLLLEVEVAEMESESAELMVKVEGALKEIETLGQLHDQLKETLGDITEEEFEKAQTKSHIKRAVMQAIWDVKDRGVIGIGNMEYIEQSGLSSSAIQREIVAFIEEESKSGVGDTSMLHRFLDAIANKYEVAVIQQANWLGFDPNSNMNFSYQDK